MDREEQLLKFIFTEMSNVSFHQTTMYKKPYVEVEVCNKAYYLDTLLRRLGLSYDEFNTCAHKYGVLPENIYIKDVE